MRSYRLPHVYKRNGGWWIDADHGSVWGPFAMFRELWCWVNPARRAVRG